MGHPLSAKVKHPHLHKQYRQQIKTSERPMSLRKEDTANEITTGFFHEQQVSMDLDFFLVLLVLFQPSVTAVLLTVEAGQTKYDSEYGGDVVLGCSFKPKLSTPRAELKVTWLRMDSPMPRDIYSMDNWKEQLQFQDPDYQGRVKLLTEEVKDGWAKLQISSLQISDSGMYQCVVQTSEGADYKEIKLSVKAPYKAVTKDIQKDPKGDGVLLTCQSEGYPESSVMWKDGYMKKLFANTTTLSTTEKLFRVTSQIRVPSSDKMNYTCSFGNDGQSATFQIPDEIRVPDGNNGAVIVTSCIGVILIVIVAAVLVYRHQNGCRKGSTRNIMVNGGSKTVLPVFCLQMSKENEEERTIFNKGSVEENLKAFVKAYYLDLSFTERPRQYWEAFGMEMLPYSLKNNEGQPVNLQALIPEAGETLLLEGSSGSGKTILAHFLVSSWTEGPTHAFPNLLDLSAVQLLLYMDCSEAKGDLFQEITTQLSIKEKMATEEELRTLLSRSSETLLLLDGYREGNQSFDESLRTFMGERGGCRLLVMACTGHCDTLRGTVGTGRVVKLQMETV
ncbi:immunoglobulin superfamily member 11-like [Cheilinus undulatus]|uniref:immunoglobulin superfamily member 11-like n=1 Tax=Cheilinus undulatus TaxID=241271 RepID=UPI001BD24408|nr:immunoglobulin superfamily member 11-like [Cheilinus undulatus]